MKQSSLKAFLSTSGTSSKKKEKIRSRCKSGSSFTECPLCSQCFPFATIECHAATCSGVVPKRRRISNLVHPSSEPLPGLFLYEEFITEDEEREILAQLDGLHHPDEFLPWKRATFNGEHNGKRWGVHCNLRDRRVDEPEHPLPSFMRDMLLSKLKRLQPMRGCQPNEANAIDYRKSKSHYLAAHVDDRKLSKEPIANLSLAGDCYMTFRNVASHRNVAVSAQRVLLKRRCLQVLTGRARYDFSHAIMAEDILSERRVSITMRESPLSNPRGEMSSPFTSSRSFPSFSSLEEPLPGLYIIPDFLTEQEETALLAQIDAPTQQWSIDRHTGSFRQKRFGVDHDLWSQSVRPPKHTLPSICVQAIQPRLSCILTFNEANAIEYRKERGDHLKSHVDDRKKHKEPIVNLSLAGDCYMTFTNVQAQRNLAPKHKRIFLPRRCLLLLKGVSRYEFAHGIFNEDLLSPRRVSITLRETPF